MPRFVTSLVTLLVTLALVLCAPPGLGAAESVEGESLFVALDVVFPAAEPATIVVKQGEFATYRSPLLAEPIAISVFATGPGSGEVTLSILAVSFKENRQPVLGKKLGDVSTQLGFEDYFALAGGGVLEIHVLGVGAVPQDLGRNGAFPPAYEGPTGSRGGLCSILCSETAVQAFAVSMRCGSCSSAPGTT